MESKSGVRISFFESHDDGYAVDDNANSDDDDYDNDENDSPVRRRSSAYLESESDIRISLGNGLIFVLRPRCSATFHLSNFSISLCFDFQRLLHPPGSSF